MKNLVFAVVIFLAALIETEAQPRLSLRASGGGAYVSWWARTNYGYRLHATENFVLWRTNAFIRGAGADTLAIVSPLRNREFFRLEEISPAGGSVLLTNGATLSGLVFVGFTAYTTNAGVQYVEFQDVAGGETNTLGFIDMKYAPTNRFALDTTRLKNFIPHRLRLKVVDDFAGPATWGTSETAGEGFSPPVTVFASNPISLNGFDGEVGWKFHLAFSTIYPVGTWTVTFTNDLGTVAKTWSGSIAAATNASGEIIVEDTDVAPFDGYEGTFFSITVTVTRPSFPALSLTARAVNGRQNVSFECLVAEQQWLPPSPLRTNFDAMISGSILPRMSLLGADFFGLRDQTRIPDAALNALENEADWGMLAAYLRGEFIQGPSHCYLWCEGGPTHEGDWRDAAARLILSTLAGAPKVAFAVVDGHNIPYGLLARLVDTEKRSRDELLQKGKYPRFGFFWKDKLFSQFVGRGDIDENHRVFMERFFERAFSFDPVTGRAQYTFREALEYARFKPSGRSEALNPAAEYIDWVGCADSYVDELFEINFEGG